AAVVALLWSALAGVTTAESRLAYRPSAYLRIAYPRLWELLRIYVRYALALILIGYGLAKVVKTQFQAPSGVRLLEPFGQSSPMGLLWTFMGFSTAYTFFAGASEVLGGVLLLWRRTTTLGAMVSAAVLFHIVMLNFCYDVPVKLYSAHLFLMAVLLLLPDLG